jgi:hypothetical protein
LCSFVYKLDRNLEQQHTVHAEQATENTRKAHSRAHVSMPMKVPVRPTPALQWMTVGPTDVSWTALITDLQARTEWNQMLDMKVGCNVSSTNRNSRSSFVVAGTPWSGHAV